MLGLAAKESLVIFIYIDLFTNPGSQRRRLVSEHHDLCLAVIRALGGCSYRQGCTPYILEIVRSEKAREDHVNGGRTIADLLIPFIAAPWKLKDPPLPGKERIFFEIVLKLLGYGNG